MKSLEADALRAKAVIAKVQEIKGVEGSAQGSLGNISGEHSYILL